jgi:hypothetical protein
MTAAAGLRVLKLHENTHTARSRWVDLKQVSESLGTRTPRLTENPLITVCGRNPVARRDCHYEGIALRTVSTSEGRSRPWRCRLLCSAASYVAVGTKCLGLAELAYDGTATLLVANIEEL